MKKFKKSLALICLAAIILALAACSNTDGQEANKEGVLATVNGKAIMKEDYDNELAYYRGYVEYLYGEGTWESEVNKDLTYKEYYENYVMDKLINLTLLLDAAEKEGITVTEEEKAHELGTFISTYFDSQEDYKSYLEQNGLTEESLLKNMTDQLMVNNYYIKKIDSLNPSNDELKALFEEMKMNIRVRASHILVDTEEEALKVIERINKGEDFSELAKELSIDTVSGANGGDLDYFNYAQMVEPFSEAAFSLGIGQVSQPVQSDYGYHIIKVTDRVVDEDITVETEKEGLIDYYKNNKFRDLLEELKNSAEIVKN